MCVYFWGENIKDHEIGRQISSPPREQNIRQCLIQYFFTLMVEFLLLKCKEKFKKNSKQSINEGDIVKYFNDSILN